MAIINDGFSTILSIAGGIFGVTALEKTISPAGWEGGGGIPITTMRNVTYRTTAPKSLQQMSNLSLTVAYDPALIGSAFGGNINLNQEITITFPDGSTLMFWGFVDEFKAQENREGEQPLASMTVIPSMFNASGVETAPVFTAA